MKETPKKIASVGKNMEKLKLTFVPLLGGTWNTVENTMAMPQRITYTELSHKNTLLRTESRYSKYLYISAHSSTIYSGQKVKTA